MLHYFKLITKTNFFLSHQPWKVICACLALMMIPISSAHAGKAWFPVTVDVWQPPFNDTRSRVQEQYMPLTTAQKKWRIHVFIPHLKDAYWLGVNYGLIDEARRLGIELSVYEAGGYGRLEIQRQQIEESLADPVHKPQAMIISAISQDGLNDLVEKAHTMEIPVVDLINGISSPRITARSAVSYWDNGYQAAMYLRGLQEKRGKPLNIAWFPGPSGPGWVAAGEAGFNAALKESAVNILDTAHGDTGLTEQSKLVKFLLDKEADRLDFIVGTTATAESAVKILRKRGLSNRIKVLAYYYSPGVHLGILRGSIVAAPTDHQVLQARLAMDVSVRILEKRAYFKHVAPRVTVVDRGNIKQWDSTTTLPPRGFRPIFSINK